MRCSGCTGSIGIETLSVIGGGSAWAASHHFTGPQGAGAGVVLRTIDGGRTWRELPFVHQPEAPGVFALDRQHVWASWTDMSTADRIVAASTDGGRSWRHSKTAFALYHLQFLDDLKGYGLGFYIDGGVQLGMTGDGGRTWTFRPLPLKSADVAHFTGQSVGWVLGADGSHPQNGVTVLRTADGGGAWSKTHITVGRAVVSRIFAWADDKIGFVVVGHEANNATSTFVTKDGGTGWSRQDPSVFGDDQAAIQGLRFFDPRRGVAIVDVGAHRSVFLTEDGGSSWKTAGSVTSREIVGTCGGTGASIWCTAGSTLISLQLH